MSPDNDLILAIDTSTRLASVALYQDGIIGEYTWRTYDDHTKELLPSVNVLLERAHISIQAIGAVAVALGPGSFNGVRVGVSTAKALALSLNIPIIGIGTLEASAFHYAGLPFPIRPLINAGRGQINSALYRGGPDAWQEMEPPEALSLQAVIERTTTPTIICGEIEEGWGAELRHHLGDLCLIPPRANWIRRASSVAELGWHRLSAGQRDDVVALQPIYLRKPAITQPKRPLFFEECR